jgi:predicted ATPase
MTIRRLEIRGFRSFEEAVWEPGSLNLLVGPNASGKSNLLTMLEWIANAARGKLFETVNAAGGMEAVRWNQTAEAVEWETCVEVHGRRASETRRLAHTVSLVPVGGSGYEVRRESLKWCAKDASTSRSTPGYLFKRERSEISGYDKQTQQLVPRKTDLDSGECFLHQVGAPRASALRRNLTGWFVYQAIPIGPDAPIRQPVITQYATRVDSDAGNLAAVLHTHYTKDRDFQSQIDDGMRAAFGPDFEGLVIQPAAAQKIQLAVRWRGSKEPHAGQQLSDGTLRFLFLLTVLSSPDPPPLVAIDEPEVGLHPSMLPLVAEYAVSAAERTQVVLTSHSPEFLDAFSEYEPNVTVCHWEDGRTLLFPVPPGSMAKWLERYRLGEMFSSGDLDAIAQPCEEVSEEVEARLAALPPEPMTEPPTGTTEGASHE